MHWLWNGVLILIDHLRLGLQLSCRGFKKKTMNVKFVFVDFRHKIGNQS